MFRRLTVLGLALLCTVSAFAQTKVPPEVDKDEVERRGNMVQDVGSTQSNEVDLIAAALAPPADDSHKWYITVVTQESCLGPCDRLKKDFAEKAELRAWANPNEPDQSWAHYHVRSLDDETQKAWFKGIRKQIEKTPSIIIQPPRNNAYGDNTTTVQILAGYDGDAKKLSGKIRDSIKTYVDAYERKQAAIAPAPQALWTGPAAGATSGKYKPRGMEQQLPFAPPSDPFAIDPNAPVAVFPPAPAALTVQQIQASVQAINGPGFLVPAEFVLEMLQTGVRTAQEVQQAWLQFLGRRQPQPAPAPAPAPQVTPQPAQTNVLDLVRDVLDVIKPQQQPTTPAATPSSGGLGDFVKSLLDAGSWVKWLAMFFGATSVVNILFGAVQVWRSFRKSTGQATLLDDAQFARLKELVDALNKNTDATTMNNVVGAQDALKAALQGQLVKTAH